MNAIGTLNILAACGGPDSPVRKVVVKSSAHYYGCERDDPAFFTESMQRPHPPRTRLESDILEAEKAVAGFADRNPDVTVTVLRFCNALGPDQRTTHTELFRLPAIPCILGFDPRYQFIHEEDLVGVLRFAAERDLPGIYNAAGDGVLALSEVASLLGKPLAPILPPWGTSLGAAALRPTGVRRADRGAQPAALRPRARQPQAQGRGLQLRLHEPRGGAQARRGAARARPAARGAASRTATNARSRSSCAGARVCVERAPCNASDIAGVPTVWSAPTIPEPHATPSHRRTCPDRDGPPRGGRDSVRLRQQVARPHRRRRHRQRR